ncbi:hypothetical protein WA026_011145 [Henosepilachna vigintioctopunctata]|uniref:purine-nucleoside phosphorylase n=1 Tax=Henosepilachna vigintioctopunctata TaxID=420089 RepID=A0AAW1U503_9CUCU
MNSEEAASFLLKKFKKSPSILIVYSIALGNFPNVLEYSIKVPCDEVPCFPAKQKGSISPQFIFGKLLQKYVLVLQGRYHYYEGYSKEEITFPVRVASLLGCKNMFITNAVGSMNKKFELGDIMLINNHLDVVDSSGDSALKVYNDNRRKFKKTSGIYDENFRAIARKLSVEEGMEKYVKTGIYAMVNRKALQTPSDILAFKTSGADVVGTSILPEVLTAVKLKLSIFGLSIVTDKRILDYSNFPDPMPDDITKSLKLKKSFILKLIERYVEYCSDAM